ncbi:MAG TPA: ATP-binding protein, partial [Acidimicrobiia bacterium]|nr:ATP-binding protein [Acidimicrobiia bacterium]
ANYFRSGNLGALRELALSWTADRVEEAVAKYRELHGIAHPWETKERVVVALAGAEGGEGVIRRAARLAMRSRADLVGVYVRPTHGLAEETSPSLSVHRELLQHLGGRYHEVVGDDVGNAVLSFAREENATQIVLGASRRSRFDEVLRGSPIAKVIRNSDAIDVHVISYEGARRPSRHFRPRRHKPISRLRLGISWGIAIIGLPIITWILRSVRGQVELRNVQLIYLLAAVVAGGVGGALPAAATAVAAFLLANWYFTPPEETWVIGSPDDLFSLFAFLVVSLAVGLLVGYSSRRSADARKARAQAEALAATTSLGHPVFESDRQGLLRRVRDVLALEAVSILRRIPEGWETLTWDGSRELLTPGDGSEVIDLTGEVVMVILDGRLSADDRIVLRAFAAQIVQAMKREELEHEAESAGSMAEADRLRTALLGAVSHDLRTPLATIKASLTSLVETGLEWTPEETQSFLHTALDETERLNRLVGQLLDASRVQVGAVHVFYRPVGLEEVVASALAGLGSSRDRLIVDISESLAEVQTDPVLLERVVANLVENALTWSPPDQPVRVSAGEVAGRIDLRISDRGPGIPAHARETAFQPFQRLGDSPNREGVGLGLAVARGLLEAMGNELVIEDTPGGGTTMVIGLKIAGPNDMPVNAGVISG